MIEYAFPPLYLPLSQMTTLHPCKFDVILLDPPFSSSFTWDRLQELPIPQLGADPSFILLWVGSGAGDGLEKGREVLAKWGYRRCEDVCWLKTNHHSNRGPGVRALHFARPVLTTSVIDRSAYDVPVNADETTLSHRHPRDCPPVYRQLVRSL